MDLLGVPGSMLWKAASPRQGLHRRPSSRKVAGPQQPCGQLAGPQLQTVGTRTVQAPSSGQWEQQVIGRDCAGGHAGRWLVPGRQGRHLCPCGSRGWVRERRIGTPYRVELDIYLGVMKGKGKG